MEEEDESGRAWKLRRKTANVGLGELYDPGALPIKLKKKEAKELGAEDVKPGVAHPLTLGGSEKPVWKPKGWNKPGEYSTDTGAAEIEAEAEEGMKKEEEGEGGSGDADRGAARREHRRGQTSAGRTRRGYTCRKKRVTRDSKGFDTV